MHQLFLSVLRARHWIAGVFLILTIAGIYGALRIPTDSAIDRLIVPDDPVAKATLEFEKIYVEGDQALLMLEAPDPLSPGILRAADHLEQQLARIPYVEAHSLLTLYRHGPATSELTDSQIEQIHKFATGTQLFRRAGLLGDHYLGMGLELRAATPAARDKALADIDALVLPLDKAGKPFTAIRRVGSPWLDAWLEKQTGAATARSMPLFGIFLVTLVFIIYRSWRALLAMVLTLGAVIAIAVGQACIFGWTNTVVSALVPLTVLVTTTATLVYIHSRYMEPDDAPTPLDHHAGALANKFLPSTASMFATAVGFAALAVSDIRPVREMGIWTAAGLIIAWVACFTLFPALQALLRTPLRNERAAQARWFTRLVDFLVPATRRYRWLFVGAAFVLMLCGAAALFGIPGQLQPLALETDPLTYVNPDERVAQDTRHFQESNGLDVMELWVQTPPGHALDPEFLRAIYLLTQRLEKSPGITAVDGPTSVLTWERYIQSGSDRLPTDSAAWPRLAEDLEQIALTEPGARSYIDVANLASIRLSIRGRGEYFGRHGSIEAFLRNTWTEAQAAEPALRTARGTLVGKGVVAGEITTRLLPTLTESFAITASVIFTAFLLVFRSPAARLMTMIPSLFAILSVFLIMRLTGLPLNIATILIGSTILGATENDQIHFFYHYNEGHNGGQAGGATAAALRHALIIAGRPILFATLINASGFLALALSDLPPMRQFGIVSSTAFVLALIADFTALPAALWILTRFERRTVTA